MMRRSADSMKYPFNYYVHPAGAVQRNASRTAITCSPNLATVRLVEEQARGWKEALLNCAKGERARL